MSRSFSSLVVVAVAVAVAGCSMFQRDAAPDAHAPGGDVAVRTPDAETVRPQSRPVEREARLGANGLTAASFDTTTEAERVAAIATPSAAGGVLGETLASLGSPAEPGFWLVTGLVSDPGPGRVELIEGNGAVNLELRPSGREPGSGSQLSLAAYQALGLPLTALPRLRVLAQ